MDFNQSTAITLPNEPSLIFSTLEFTGSSIGLITDALIIYTIYANKILHTRINRFVAAWAVCDFFSTTSEPVIRSFTPNHEKLQCVIMQSSLLFPSCCLLIMLLMIWNVSVNAMSVLTASLSLGTIAFNITTCVFEFNIMHVVYAVWESNLFMLLIISCVSNIVLYFRSRSELLTHEECYKYGVFRLGYRLWILCYVLFYLLNNLQLLELTGYVNIFVTLIPVIMFFYLSTWNDAFKIAVCLFKKRVRRDCVSEDSDIIVINN